MNGKALAIGLVGIAAIAGAGLWYSIERLYYGTVRDVSEVRVKGEYLPVSGYNGINAATSPLKMRACFDVDWDYIASDEFATMATPLQAPRFFNCFNAEEMTRDLQSGKATAILADQNRPYYGFDKFIVQYPNGRVYMWRQMNECGKAWYGGDDMPADCPVPTTEIIEQEDGIIIKSQVSVPAHARSRVAAMVLPMNVVIGLMPYVGSKLGPIAVENLKVVAEDANPLAFVGEQDVHPGIDRVIAIYGDGRAYAWHQKSKSE